jgi:hypothetical protein
MVTSKLSGILFPVDFLSSISNKHILMKKLLVFLPALILTATLIANNITISNLSLTGKNATDHFTLVQFDISWENSWRTSTNESNWDAAWIFVKYRVAGGEWHHAWLNESGHTAPSGSITMAGINPPKTEIQFHQTEGILMRQPADRQGDRTQVINQAKTR